MKTVERLVGIAALLSMLAAPAHAAKPDWDRKTNVREAAERLATMHRTQGSPGVMKFLDACYRTHTISEAFTSGLEACMAQDYMHSRALAAIYANLPAEARSRPDIPKPDAIAKAMGQRFALIFHRYKIDNAAAEQFRKLVDEHGFPVFTKSVFPGSAPPAAPADPGTSSPPSKK